MNNNISDKEKSAAITLLEARIERMTGKKVTYVNNATDEIKNLHEQLEKLTGKKVVFAESKAVKLAEAVKKFIAENEMTAEEVEEGLGTQLRKVGSALGVAKSQEQLDADKAMVEKAYDTALAAVPSFSKDPATDAKFKQIAAADKEAVVAAAMKDADNKKMPLQNVKFNFGIWPMNNNNPAQIAKAKSGPMITSPGLVLHYASKGGGTVTGAMMGT